MILSFLKESHATLSSKVGTCIAEALADGIADLTGLLHRLPGVYPTELLASFYLQAATRAIGPTLYSTAHQEAKHGSSSGVDGRSLLPLPHPLDYEWRYTADAARALLNYAPTCCLAAAMSCYSGRRGWRPMRSPCRSAAEFRF